MKIGLEWQEGFRASSVDLQFPYKVICFAAERLSSACWCVEYIQARRDLSEGCSFCFKAIIVPPARHNFARRKEVEFTCGLSKYSGCKISSSFSDEDVKKAGEGLVEAIATAIDSLAYQVKFISDDLATLAKRAREADAISRK